MLYTFLIDMHTLNLVSLFNQALPVFLVLIPLSMDLANGNDIADDIIVRRNNMRNNGISL